MCKKNWIYKDRSWIKLNMIRSGASRLWYEHKIFLFTITLDIFIQGGAAGDSEVSAEEDVDPEKLRRELEEFKRQAEQFKEQLKQKDKDLEEYKKALGEISDKSDSDKWSH